MFIWEICEKNVKILRKEVFGFKCAFMPPDFAHYDLTFTVHLDTERKRYHF